MAEKKLVSVSPTGDFEVDLDDGRTLSATSKLKDVIMWERAHKAGFLKGGDLSFMKMLWISFAALKRTGQIQEFNTVGEFIDHVDDLRQEDRSDDEDEDEGDEGVELPNPIPEDSSV
jgi:hypothetical protein